MHVVSNDNGWIAALNGNPNIHIYRDVTELLDLISKRQEMHDNIVRFIKNMSDDIDSRTNDWLMDYEWISIIDEIEPCIESQDIDNVDIEEINLHLEGIEYIDCESKHAEAVCSGIARITIEFTYLDHSCETYDKEDHVWYNTKSGDGKAYVTVPIYVLLKIDLPECEADECCIASCEFDDFKSNQVKITDYELNENDDYDPFEAAWDYADNQVEEQLLENSDK
ncbi:MAG TPA: hypothetical protein PLT66_07565 [Bacillota bacterium]|nr:hypothetical protein [Bacillota bacterium]